MRERSYLAAARTAEECAVQTPHPRLHYFAAQALAKAGHHAHAVREYRVYLDSASRESAQLRSSAQRELEAELRATAQLSLSLTPPPKAPADCVVRAEYLDDPRPPLTLAHAVEVGDRWQADLDRGRWHLVAECPGYLPGEQELVLAGAAQDTTLALQRPPVAPQPVVEPAPPAPPSPNVDELRTTAVRRSTIGLSAAAATLGLGGLGAVGTAAASFKDTFAVPRQCSTTAVAQIIDCRRTVFRDAALHSSGAFLLGTGLGASLGVVLHAVLEQRGAGTRRKLRAALLATGGVLLISGVGWSISAAEEFNDHNRDGSQPWDSPGYRSDVRGASSQHAAALGLAGSGTGLLISSIVYAIIERSLRGGRAERRLVHRSSKQ